MSQSGNNDFKEFPTLVMSAGLQAETDCACALTGETPTGVT